jgi:hypothetical protein
MTTQSLPPLDFLSPEPLSLKAIDQTWLNKRAAELANPETPDVPNIEGALLEALDQLYERIGTNAKDDVPALVFAPDNATDPYVVGISLDRRSGRERRGADRGPANPTPLMPDTKENTLREDFENLLFESGSFDPGIVTRDGNGRYLVPWVNARWEGFQMYHSKLVVNSTGTFKNKYTRTLGRYVIGKVAVNGGVIFKQIPFRHQTKALALEEANRLSVDLGGAFAVFRCLDIIENPEK